MVNIQCEPVALLLHFSVLHVLTPLISSPEMKSGGGGGSIFELHPPYWPNRKNVNKPSQKSSFSNLITHVKKHESQSQLKQGILKKAGLEHASHGLDRRQTCKIQ